MKKYSYFLLRRLNDFYKNFKGEVCLDDLEKNYICPLLKIVDDYEFKVQPFYTYFFKKFIYFKSLDYIVEALFIVSKVYFSFDAFDKCSSIISKLRSVESASNITIERIIYNEKILNKYESIIRKIKKRDSLTSPSNQNNQIIEEQIKNSPPHIELSLENVDDLPSNHLIEKAYSNQTVLSLLEKVKTYDALLGQAFESDDRKLFSEVGKVYKEFISNAKEDSNYNILETRPEFVEAWVGFLITKLKNLLDINDNFKLKEDFLDSFELMIDLWGIPKFEKYFYFMFAIEEIILKKNEFITCHQDIVSMEIMNNDKQKVILELYQNLLSTYKKLIILINNRLTNSDNKNILKNEFLIEMFKKISLNSDKNNKNRDILISVLICYIYLEIRTIVNDGVFHSGNFDFEDIAKIESLKNFFFAFWTILKVMKNIEKYELIKRFVSCLVERKILNFFKSVCLILLVNFKSHYKNNEEEMEKKKTIFSFDPVMTNLFIFYNFF